MYVKRVSPEEAQALMQDQGWAYVDVRSVPEFEQGHPAAPVDQCPGRGFTDSTCRTGDQCHPPGKDILSQAKGFDQI